MRTNIREVPVRGYTHTHTCPLRQGRDVIIFGVVFVTRVNILLFRPILLIHRRPSPEFGFSDGKLLSYTWGKKQILGLNTDLSWSCKKK